MIDAHPMELYLFIFNYGHCLVNANNQTQAEEILKEFYRSKFVELQQVIKLDTSKLCAVGVYTDFEQNIEHAQFEYVDKPTLTILSKETYNTIDTL